MWVMFHVADVQHVVDVHHVGDVQHVGDVSCGGCFMWGIFHVGDVSCGGCSTCGGCLTCGDVQHVCRSLLYSAILRSRADSLYSCRVCDSK